MAAIVPVLDMAWYQRFAIIELIRRASMLKKISKRVLNAEAWLNPLDIENGW